jgi:hypothetical protein
MNHDRTSSDRTPLVTDLANARTAAAQLAAGAAVAHGFGNFYAITSRGNADCVRRVNVMKGRPPEQVGSVTVPPARIAEVFDWDALPEGMSRACVDELFDAFFGLGPFGFRGPARAGIVDQLTSMDGDIRTTQVIAPGYACPSNSFLELAVEACDGDLLYVTSANRSRHLTGADDTPAHWRAAPLRDEFGDELIMLAHADEDAARDRYPLHLPMSTTIIGFHRLGAPYGRLGRPAVVLERHGSLHVDDVRHVLDGIGLDLMLGPRARTRLALREYAAA